MRRAARVGETIEGRWVVLGSEPRRGRTVVHVRDRRWSGCRLTWIPCPAGADRPLFRKLAERWASIGPHPGLIACYGPRPLKDRLVACVEHAPGPTLGSLLEDRSIPADRAMRWGLLLFDALREVHAHRLVHGAVDPDACLMDSAGELRLGELALGTGRTATPGYAPLEGGSTPEADVYGAAAIFYRLLTGREPFGPGEAARRVWSAHLGQQLGGWGRLSAWFGVGDRGRSNATLMALLRRGPEGEAEVLRMVRLLQAGHAPLPLRDVGVEVDRRVEALLLAALDADPGARPSAADLVGALREKTVMPAPGPYEIRATTLKALTLEERGEGARAEAALRQLVEDNPRALHPWLNLQVLALRADPARLFEVQAQLQRYTRSLGTAGWDDAVEGFAARLSRRILVVDGAVRDLAVRGDGAVALAGAFSTGARLWAVQESGGSRPIRWGAGAVDEVHVLDGGDLLVRAAVTLIRVGRRGVRPVWTQTLGGMPRNCAVGGAVVVAALKGNLVFLDPQTGAERERLAVPGVRQVAVSKAGQVAWRTVDGVWARRQGAVRQVAPGRVDAMAWAGERLAVVAEGAVRVEVEGDLRTVADLEGAEGAGVLAAGEETLAVVAGRQVRVIDLEGKVLGELPATGPVTAVALGEEPGVVVVGDAHGVVRRWSLQGEDWPPVVPDPDSWTGGNAVQRDVGEVTLLRQERGSGSGVLLGVLGVRRDWSARYAAPVAAVTFDADNTLLAVAEEREVHVSRITGRTVHLDALNLSCNAPVRALAFSPDGRELAAALGDAFGTETPSPGPVQAGARLMVQEGDDVSFSVPVGPAGLTIGRSHDRDLVIPDTRVSRRHCTIRWVGGRCVVRDDGSANGFLVNGRRCWEAVLDDGDRIQLGAATLTYTVSSDSILATEPLPLERQARPPKAEMPTLMMQATDLAALDDVPVGRADVAVVWRLGGQQAPRVLPGHRGAVRAVCFRSGGGLISGGEDAVLRLWQPGSLAPAAELQPLAEAGSITSVAVSWDDRWALVGYDDRAARLWDLQGRRIVRTFEGHRRAVTAVALSNDGRRAVTGSMDGTARIWSCRTGQRLATLTGHTGTVTAVGFSPDDRVVLTGSEDGRLCVWHRVTGELLEDVEVGGDGITAVGFSPDGRQLATGGRDGSVQVWMFRWLWSFLEDVVRAAEALFQPEPGISITWPSAERDLDFWLDVWGDLRRCSSEDGGVPPDLAARLVAVRARVRGEIASRVPTRSGGALGTSIGFGAAPSATPEGAEPPFGPHTAVAQVDPELASSLG